MAEKYKYKFDEDRSDLLIDLYRVKRKAEKMRNNCDKDDVLAYNDSRNLSKFYANESENLDILIADMNEIIRNFNERCNKIDKNPTKNE